MAGAVACDGPTGPSGGGAPEPTPTLAGTWFGSALLPNGFSARMTLQQSGASVNGTMTISGQYVDQPLTGTYASGTRALSWSVTDGCERWSGALTLSTDGRRLSGTLARDGRGCVPPVRDASGTLTFDKQ
jgi:hypothetical protein